MTNQSVLPSQKQRAYQSWEFGMFIHFGLRTFYEGYVDFDERPMSPSSFNPTELDCEQWIRTAKEAGMKYAVLTAKHHDGFSNWPSNYTNFSVAHSPWKGGQGDVVGEFIAACRKYGVKPGLYYSPYDGSVDFYNQDGKAYDDYFVNQITELLGNYGEIDILWLDGAGSEDHEYDWPRIVKKVRELQPNILIFNMADPDIRWVGNEDGIAPLPCWNVVDAVDVSIHSEQQNQLGDKLWLPAECDVQMRANWFYSDYDEHTVKSLEQLMGIYYYSVGRGANLLLNIGPNRQGLLPEPDKNRLLEFGREIERRFTHPLATLEDCWADAGRWVYQTEQPYLLDHVVIEEDLQYGERVKQFKLSIETAKSRQPITVYKGENIGNKAIVTFPPVMVHRAALEITESSGEARICGLTFYYIGR